MKSIIKGIAMLGIFTLVILSIAVRHTQAASPEVVLRYAGNLPLGHHFTRNQEFFAKLVMERTKGRVKVEVYPAGQLFTDKDLTRALPGGALDMGLATIQFWEGIVPSTAFISMPFLFDDFAYTRRVLESEASEILKEDIRKRAGVRVLNWAYHGGMIFVSKTPLRSLEDFKGKRIRGVGESWLRMIQSLGAAPTSLGGGEIYTGLQRGIVDAVITGISAVGERKLYEVTKYLSYPNLTIMVFCVLINEKKWDSLPSDIQKIMLESAKEAEIDTFNEAQKTDKESLVFLKEKGMDIYDPPEQQKARWKEACKQIFDIPAERAGETGRVLMEIARKLR